MAIECVKLFNSVSYFNNSEVYLFFIAWKLPFIEGNFFQMVLEDPDGNLKILKKVYSIQLI